VTPTPMATDEYRRDITKELLQGIMRPQGQAEDGVGLEVSEKAKKQVKHVYVYVCQVIKDGTLCFSV
jgi:hypothetical protein